MAQPRTALSAPINPVTTSSELLDALAVAAVGGVLIGMSGRNTRGSALVRLAGYAMLGLAARPFLSAAVRKAGASRRTVAMTSTIEIARPVAEVFAFFKDFENFPRVIGSVRSVLDYQDGRSHWELYTPSGAVVAWDAVVTKYVPNSVIAWESVVRSLVDSSGIVRFTALSPSRTRVDIAITHRPMQTTLKDAVRTFLAPRGSNVIDRDLDRIRFYLESLPVAPKVSSADAAPDDSAYHSDSARSDERRPR